MRFKTKWLGIGGIKCPCCTFMLPKETKRRVNRDFRRKGKLELKESLRIL